METCLLKEKYLHPCSWVEVFNCASDIQTRVPYKSMIEATPFETLLGHKTNVSHLRFFGSNAWDKIPIDKRKNFQDQSSNAY